MCSCYQPTPAVSLPGPQACWGSVHRVRRGVEIDGWVWLGARGERADCESSLWTRALFPSLIRAASISVDHHTPRNCYPSVPAIA